jgi:uncharacterized protein
MEKKKHIRRIMSKLLPREYNFFRALLEHSEKVTEGICALEKWFETRDPELALKVREIEHEADEIMLKIASELGKVFATPIDREDIHLLSVAIDQIINYGKNTVRELEIFDITPDDNMIQIIKHIMYGTIEIEEAIKALPSFSPEIKEHLEKAIKCERRVEKLYRKGVNHLFDGDDLKEILKRREVYRHLSNTADRIEDAASMLSMILVKYG